PLPPSYLFARLHRAGSLRDIPSFPTRRSSDLLGQAVAGIAAGDMHYETQVRHDQLTGCVQIFLIVQTVSQLALFLDTQYRDAAYGLNIGLQVGTWRKVMYGLQSSAHVWTPESS